jgi:Universal stress protein UspA and related nucleotide-binding proteins
MNPDIFASPPRAVLLATDLSARCDRALDRALLLARQCQARLVRDHVRDHPVDLVVVGSQGRSALSEILLGSVANRILETVETDTLLVQQRQA